MTALMIARQTAVRRYGGMVGRDRLQRAARLITERPDAHQHGVAMPDRFPDLTAAVRAERGESGLAALMPAPGDPSLARATACAPDSHPVAHPIAALRCGPTTLADSAIRPLPALRDASVRLIGTAVRTTMPLHCCVRHPSSGTIRPVHPDRVDGRPRGSGAHAADQRGALQSIRHRVMLSLASGRSTLSPWRRRPPARRTRRSCGGQVHDDDQEIETRAHAWCAQRERRASGSGGRRSSGNLLTTPGACAPRRPGGNAMPHPSPPPRRHHPPSEPDMRRLAVRERTRATESS